MTQQTAKLTELTQCSAAIRKYKRHLVNEHRAGTLDPVYAMRFTAKLTEWEAQVRKKKAEEAAVAEVLRNTTILSGEVTE